jgi:glycosyltransferase involved in cell wall biosynthesis
MGVDDVGSGQGGRQGGRDGMSGVTEMRDRPQDPHAQPVLLADARAGAEGHELALHMAGEGAGELDGIALAAAEDPGVAERRGRDVNDPHLVLCLVTLGDPRRLTGGYLYHLRMAAAAPRHAARIIFLSFPARPFPLPALAAPRVLGRVRRLGARAILLDSIAAAFAGPWLALRSVGSPVIGVLHQPPGGIDHGAVRARVQAPLDRLAYDDARLLIVASDHLADQLAAAGIPREGIRVVPPGRDVATRSSQPGDLRRGRQAAFLCVANWIERKGILELLDAVARLPPEAATLHLAGSEDEDPAYAARIRRRLTRPDLTERVSVHGALSRDRIAGLYAGADAFVLPAFREPYGTVWGEAMAFGLPVVGWRAGNLPYLADDGREGLLVAPGDIDGLARALGLLATDPALRRRLGAAARRRALERPTWEESAALFFTAIRAALDESGAMPGGARRRLGGRARRRSP